jgi:hypothetical protein
MRSPPLLRHAVLVLQSRFILDCFVLEKNLYTFFLLQDIRQRENRHGSERRQDFGHVHALLQRRLLQALQKWQVLGGALIIHAARDAKLDLRSSVLKSAIRFLHNKSHLGKVSNPTVPREHSRNTVANLTRAHRASFAPHHLKNI